MHKKEGPGAVPHVITRERYATSVNDNMKEIIVGMIQEQNKQLDSVIQQLNILTKKELADTLKNRENLNDLLATRDRISNEVLLEMIREQNLRLNDVVEQLKLLSQNQQNSQSGAYSNLPRVDRVPPPAPHVSSQEYLDASLGYGKAIQLYQNQQYKKAIHTFQALLKGGIDVTLRDNCHFWIGVCFFNLNKANQAIDEFTSVLNTSGSDKMESAYFMIGQCYEQIGEKKLAMVAFEKMLQEYPRGSLKQVAEIKLALLK